MFKTVALYMLYLAGTSFGLYYLLVCLAGCATDLPVNGPQGVVATESDIAAFEAAANSETACPSAPTPKPHKHSSGGGGGGHSHKAYTDRIAALDAENAQLRADLETLNGALNECLASLEGEGCPEPVVCPESPACEETTCPEQEECPVCEQDDGNQGHGNDNDHDDESNPGQNG